jgi:hypothetical protein
MSERPKHGNTITLCPPLVITRQAVTATRDVVTLKSGWVDGQAVPAVADAAPGSSQPMHQRLRPGGLARQRTPAARQGAQPRDRGARYPRLKPSAVLHFCEPVSRRRPGSD